MTQDARNEKMRAAVSHRRAVNRNAVNRNAGNRQGFTLIEILVVIIIIGILAALLVPAIGGAIRQAKMARIKLEVTNLATAVEQYHNTYGDYPPDFSDWGVVQRHFRKAFPKMDPGEKALLGSLTHDDDTGKFSAVGIDRAEALVLTLGGYSSDPAHPLTGSGGPLEYIGSGDVTHRNNYQYRADRDNAFFNFDVAKMPMQRMDASQSLSQTNKLASTDEADFGTGPWADPLPVYRGAESVAPYVYFESRTYGYIPSVDAFNGYGPKNSSTGLASGPLGAVRPYKTDRPNPKTGTAAYGNLPAASKAYDFMNADTFQIISAGPDGRYGTIVDQPNGAPVYFLFPTGQAMLVNASATSPGDMTSNGYNGYQENGMNPSIVENGHLDNVTNFSAGKLEDEIVE